MVYTQEEIHKYLSIMEDNIKNNLCPNFPSSRGVLGGGTPPCCDDPKFIIWSGYRLCENCSTTSGHVLGYFDAKEYDRFHFQKKSIYQPKYYYEKKVSHISDIIDLSDEEKSLVYDKLIKIDEKMKKKINADLGRKRLVNVLYLIKKILEEIGSAKSEEIYLKIGKKTLNNYDKWWENYQRVKIYGFPP